MKKIELDGEHLTVEEVVEVAYNPGHCFVTFSPEAVKKMQRSREVVEELVRKGEVIYGITTGFGYFKDRVIESSRVRELQRNLILSHSAGVGDYLSVPETRAMMLIRANSFARGHSGIRPEVAEMLLAMLNAGVHPLVPRKGSVGASGDLAPLAHMALVMIGEGEALYGSEKLPGAEALKRAGLSPITLEAKEGLALTNGTSLIAALSSLAVHRAWNLVLAADIAGAMSLEALWGTLKAFNPSIHRVRPYPSQIECAEFITALLEGSDFVRPSPSAYVHDPYSLRCIPQVHGAVRGVVSYVKSLVEIEINSATDNPLIFPEDGYLSLSGGNFHGEPLALAMDYLAIALTDLGNMSERRIARLLDEKANGGLLPPFLTEEGGLNSGFMLAQYTAAALASENKVLSHPASVDTIPTSANVEDHVSMGTLASDKALKVMENVEIIVAIELMAAAQAIDFRRRSLGPGAKMGRGTEAAYRLIRTKVPFIARDEPLHPHILKVHELVREGILVKEALSAIK